MKVKLGQLKTHFSRYVRKLRETGEPIEVCVREETVAYLTPAHQKESQDGGRNDAARIRSLEQAGLHLVQVGSASGLSLQPRPAAQPAGGENSVETIRSGRPW